VRGKCDPNPTRLKASTMLGPRRLRLTLALTVVLAGLLASTALAAAITQTAKSGSLSASFSFRKLGNFSYRLGALTIRRGATLQYSRPVRDRLCGKYCMPGATSAKDSSIAWRKLSATGSQLLLDLYSGGAHCCSIAEVFSQAPGAGHWTKTSFDFGDPGYELVDLDHDGIHEFLSADDRFAYAFTDYAASGMPLLIMRFSNGHFRDVTSSYPSRIARDAARWMKAFEQQRPHYSDTTGIIAAWAADEDALGNRAKVARFLQHAAAAHELNSGLGDQTPQNAKFVAALDRSLRKWGYLS
jgi:hypothetical protein